jgi:hypothetical protein
MLFKFTHEVWSLKESNKSENHHSNNLNLPDLLGEQGKVYLGTLSSGENIVIEYTLTKDNKLTKAAELIQPNQLTQFVQQSEQAQSASQQLIGNRGEILNCLNNCFIKRELEEIWFTLDLGYRWEDIERDSRDQTAMAIIDYCERKLGREAGYEKIISEIMKRRDFHRIKRYFSSYNS